MNRTLEASTGRRSSSKAMKRKPKRPHYGRILFTFVCFAGILFMLGKLGFNLFIKQHDSYLVDFDRLDIKADYNALIIRNEIVVNTPLKGEMTYYADEGDAVVKGEPLVEIFNDGLSVADETETELEVNQKQIEFDYTVLEYDIMTLKDQILFAINQGDYVSIPALKQSLILKLETREKLEGENKFLANRTSSYTEKTIGEGSLDVGEKATLNAPANGILTFELDGYEDYLTIDNIYNINYDEISSLSVTPKSTKSTYSDGSSAIFKLIDESTYYLVIQIDNDVVDTFQKGRTVTVSIGESQYQGEVYDVFSSGEGSIAVLRMDDGGDAIFDQRTIACTVINDNYEGLKTYVDSIINVDGQIGVYRVNEERKLVFVPVKVLGYDDDYAIVQGDQYYDESLGVVRTLSVGQEVIRNAATYKEGDIIQ